MVLEEATSSQEPSSTSFPESLPTSDIDPYSGDRNPAVLSTRDPSYVRISPPNTSEPIYVNLNSLPKRWGFLGPQAHPPQLVNAIVESCNMAAHMLGRPVRQEEADALAFHFAKSVKIGSYGTPVGVSLAMLQAYRGIATYRFPGWTPGDKWRARGYPDVFGPLKGARARAMWQAARFNVYAFVGAMTGQIFFGSYALTVGSAGRLMDSRLKELSEKVKERAQSGKRGELLPGKREVDVTAGPRDGETLDMARQRQRAQQGWKRNSRQQGQEQVDDMSPTGGAFGDEFADMSSSGDTGMMSDSQVAVEEYKRQQEDQQRQNEAPLSILRTPAPQRQVVDNASPTTRSDETPKQTGSAWERLRQQAATSKGLSSPTNPKTTQTSTRSRDAASTGDSFFFSQAEEDKQIAKTEAQKEFDSRIEREREGKDFDDRGAGQTRWRR